MNGPAATVEKPEPAQSEESREPEAPPAFNMRAMWAIWLPASILAFLLTAVPYASGYQFYRRTLGQFLQEFWKLEDWEHCWLVPIAIAFILYSKREELAKVVPKPSAWGLPIAAAGFFFYWAGYRVDNYYIGFGAMQILVAAAIILQLGWRFMLALSFPWMFMVFMWPLLFLDNYLAFPLRLIMSDASVHALNFIGIDSIKHGTAILSAPDTLLGRPAGESFSVDVADPCSGIRSLFALMMVSALYGYFVFNSIWKRWAIFFCSIPLAVFGNLVRILILTLGTIMFGADFAIGEGIEDPSWFHMAAGYMVFAVAIAGMLGIGALLNLDPKKIKNRLREIRDKATEPAETRKLAAASPAVEDEY